MLKVAVKNLLGHKLRTLFTAVAIALGVGFMAGTFVLTDTVSRSFDSIFTDANAGIDAVVRGQTTIKASAFDGGEQRPDIDPALIDVVRDVDGVAAAELNVVGFGSVVDDEGKPLNNTAHRSAGTGPVAPSSTCSPWPRANVRRARSRR